MHRNTLLARWRMVSALTKSEKINPARERAGFFCAWFAIPQSPEISRGNLEFSPGDAKTPGQPGQNPRPIAHKSPPIAPESGQKTPENHEKRPENAEKRAKKRRKIEPKKIAPFASLSTLGKVRASDPASGRRGTFMTPYLSLLYGEGKLNMGHGQGNNVAPCRWREGWRLCFTQTIP